MERRPIAIDDFSVCPHQLWAEQWLLLTSGDYEAGRFNTMTVAWGSFGTMWNKPFAQVVVRPVRYTHEFTEQYDSFTLSAFPEEYRDALKLLGTRSGRDCDKIAQSGLTPIAAAAVAAPAFAEAELVVECRKLYRQRMDPGGFLDPEIGTNYPAKDYHTIYFGQIVAVSGTDRFGA